MILELTALIAKLIEFISINRGRSLSCEDQCCIYKKPSIDISVAYFFLGHFLHKNGLQKQTGIVTLVSSQERRALAIPQINRLSTTYAPILYRGFCSSVGFKYDLDCLCFRGVVHDCCLRYAGVHEGQKSSGRTGSSFWLGYMPPRPEPPSRVRGMFAF